MATETWTGGEIAQAFLNHSAHLHYHRGQGVDGIDLQEQYHVDGEPAVNWYVWVEAFVDLDVEGWFLLDVRTQTDNGESRDFLLVRSGGEHNGEWEWQRKPISFHAPVEYHRARIADGLTWLGKRIETILEQEDPMAWRRGDTG